MVKWSNVGCDGTANGFESLKIVAKTANINMHAACLPDGFHYNQGAHAAAVHTGKIILRREIQNGLQT